MDRIQKENIHIPELELSDTALLMAHLIIEYHSKNDSDGFGAINAYSAMSRQNKRRAIKLYKIFKNMDGLDMKRFVKCYFCLWTLFSSENIEKRALKCAYKRLYGLFEVDSIKPLPTRKKDKCANRKPINTQFIGL